MNWQKPPVTGSRIAPDNEWHFQHLGKEYFERYFYCFMKETNTFAPIKWVFTGTEGYKQGHSYAYWAQQMESRQPFPLVHFMASTHDRKRIAYLSPEKHYIIDGREAQFDLAHGIQWRYEIIRDYFFPEEDFERRLASYRDESERIFSRGTADATTTSQEGDRPSHEETSFPEQVVNSDTMVDERDERQEGRPRLGDKLYNDWLDQLEPIPSGITQGLQLEVAETRLYPRDPLFQEGIPRLYGFRCAVCGSGIRTPDGSGREVQAAHIVPKSKDGKDHVQNGICLCRLHHWAFDAGWMSFADDGTILVRENIPLDDDYEPIARRRGQRLRRPSQPDCGPSSMFLREHRRAMGFEAG
jgi:hypothetical protein